MEISFDHLLSQNVVNNLQYGEEVTDVKFQSVSKGIHLTNYEFIKYL